MLFCSVRHLFRLADDLAKWILLKFGEFLLSHPISLLLPNDLKHFRKTNGWDGPIRSTNGNTVPATLPRQHLCYIAGKKEALTQQRGYGTKSITVAAVHTVEEEQFSFLLDNRWVNIKA